MGESSGSEPLSRLVRLENLLRPLIARDGSEQTQLWLEEKRDVLIGASLYDFIVSGSDPLFNIALRWIENRWLGPSFDEEGEAQSS
jgi:hypothetical protein